MANTPIDKVPAMMQEDFGTVTLITDRAADKYLEQAHKERSTQKKFTKFCGGAGGWSDYTERWH